MPEEIKKCNPCQFYGFFININDLLGEIRDELNVIDIEHEDITNQKLIENGR